MTEAEQSEMFHRLELLEATVEQQRMAVRSVLGQLDKTLEKHGELLALHDKRLEIHGKMLEALTTMSDDIRGFMRDVQAILGAKVPGDAEAVPRVEP